MCLSDCVPVIERECAVGYFWKAGPSSPSLPTAETYFIIPHIPLTNTSPAGLCVRQPVGGLNLPLGLPHPLVYFPLTGGSLTSWPWASWEGVAVPGAGAAEGSDAFGEAQWDEDDAAFLIALRCDRGGYWCNI